MQHLNNDMEELFRKAADNYPLKTDSADFNKIIAGLTADQENVSPKKKSGENKKYRKFLWLLLLLPLGYVSILQFNKFRAGEIAGYYHLKKNEIVVKDHLSLQKPENFKKKNDQLKVENKNTGNEHDLTEVKADHTNTARKNITAPAQNKEILISSDGSGKNSSKKQFDPNDIPGFQLPQVFSSNQQVVKSGNDLYNAGKGNRIISSSLAGINSTVVFPLKIVDKNTSSNSDSSGAKPGKKAGNGQHKFLNHFYAGLMAGVDFSTIKFQSIQHTGFNIGVLAGYHLNRKFSIETGLWWDRKKYYSDGKYLNTVKLNLPYNIKVIDLSGSCDMFEIPLNIRYNVDDHKKGKWFATAGISSYIMMHEDYNYAADNMGYYYNAYSSYKNGSRNFLSVMHASLGYEYPIKKAGKLRIEPYLKIPLHGLGTGSLPITSTGINIGFTPKFK